MKQPTTGKLLPPQISTLDMKPEEFTEGKFMDVCEECGCDKQEEDVLEEVTWAQNFIGKELLQMVHEIGSAKVEMLEMDLNLERNIILQGIEKLLTLYCKLHGG